MLLCWAEAPVWAVTASFTADLWFSAPLSCWPQSVEHVWGWSSVPEFRSGLTKTWRKRVSEESSWQTAACVCLGTRCGNTCQRRQADTRRVKLLWHAWRRAVWPDSVWLVEGSSGLGDGMGPLHSSCSAAAVWGFLTPSVVPQPISEVNELMYLFHLVSILLHLLIHKGEGFPGSWGGLARRTLLSFKDSPFSGKPPVQKRLKLRPLNRSEQNHGF